MGPTTCPGPVQSYCLNPISGCLLFMANLFVVFIINMNSLSQPLKGGVTSNCCIALYRVFYYNTALFMYLMRLHQAAVVTITMNKVYNKVSRCLARYSPRATTTNRPTNRAPNKPAWPGPN